MQNDIQINQKTKLKNIELVAKKLGLTKTNIEMYGNTKAKISPVKGKRKAKLILITGVNPTRSGEGKTTVAIGLSDALVKMGKKSVLALREPSMGPVFGLKGGATGGGYAQVAPIEDINLHFTGDMHAIATANNLIAAVIDNTIYWGNELDIQEVIWKRCIDMNDRSLRNIETTIKKGSHTETAFQITAASEIMAVFCLAKDLADLAERLDRIVIAYDSKGKAVYAKALNITGALIATLKDAFKPNLVQTLENNPAIVHGGPFANIAHGANSVVATDLAMKVSDYVITEAGFGADLGMEKFLNIKSRVADLNPNAIVIVATIRALKEQGSLEEGIKLLEKHLSNIKAFNINYVIALNSFTGDDKEDVKAFEAWAKSKKHPCAFTTVWAKGSKGGAVLAKEVLKQLSTKKVKFTYETKDTIKTKVTAIAKNIYGASKVEFSRKAEASMKLIAKNKLDRQPICMAKTPASITDDHLVKGLPTEKWTLSVTDVSISNGAGFVVVYSGEVMTMPGLGRRNQAQKISFDGKKINGLD